jgi:hypothetical protein
MVVGCLRIQVHFIREMRCGASFSGKKVFQGNQKAFKFDVTDEQRFKLSAHFRTFIRRLLMSKRVIIILHGMIPRANPIKDLWLILVNFPEFTKKIDASQQHTISNIPS